MPAIRTITSLVCCSIIALTLSSCINTKKSKTNTTQKILSKQEIDDFIVKQYKATKENFRWKDASDEILYSAVMQSDSFLSIAYMPEEGMTAIEFFSSNKTKESYKNNENRLPDELVVKRDEILARILEIERAYKQQPKLMLKDILPLKSEKPLFPEVLPHLYVKISSPAVVSELRKNKFIIGLEPRWYDPSNVYKTIWGSDYGN